MLVLAIGAVFVAPAPPALGGMFVQDGLAIFAKRLFLVATFIGLLAGLSLPDRVFARRSAEYHLLILASLLGMLVLASARDLILLFLAFELMSIPLYVLAGFLKREAIAVEASLKFFLVGIVSSAVMAYGLSFIYGATGTTDLAKHRRGRGGRPARCSRSGWSPPWPASRSRSPPSRSTCGCRTRTRRLPRLSWPG